MRISKELLFMDLPTHQSMDGCGYANISMRRMSGTVYLDTSLTSAILGAVLSQLFCIKISHCLQRQSIINAVQLELNVLFFF